MFDHMSMKRVKENYERMTKRVAGIRKENEKVIGRGLQVAVEAGAVEHILHRVIQAAAQRRIHPLHPFQRHFLIGDTGHPVDECR